MAARPVHERSFKRSIDGIFTVFANLKNQKTGEVDKPLKAALYNVSVLILLGAIVGVVLVLLPFMKPLFWAFLFGAVLFPAKKKLSNAINNWIDQIESEDVHIMWGVVVSPFNGLEKLGEFITRWLITHMKILFILLCCIISLRMIIYFVPSELFSSILSVIVWLQMVFEKIVWSLNSKLLLTLIVAYSATVIAFWSASSSHVFTFIGQGVWMFIVAYACSFLGDFIGGVAFVGVLIYGLFGMIYDEKSFKDVQLIEKFKKIIVKPSPVEELPKEPSASAENFPATPMGRLMKTKNHFSEIKQKMQLNLKDQQKSNGKVVELESDSYFKILFYACAAVIMWSHLWIVSLCFIPITFYGAKELCKILGLWRYVEDQWKSRSEFVASWMEPRRHALLPMCLPGVLQLNSKLNKFICAKLKSFVDDISAVVMILFLIAAVIFLSVFFFFQIYSETIAVAQLGSNLINRTLSLRPDLVEMLPINMQSMNDIIDNAYKYSRGTIEVYLDGVFNETDTEQANKLKAQILSVWDRLVQSYMDRNYDEKTVGPRVTSESVFSTLDEIVTTSGLTFSGLFTWVKSNMVLEVSDSIWMVLKANLNLLVSAITTLFSVVLGSSQTMIKFMFNTIIFFTTLYYLLQSSQDRYAPIAMNINSGWGSKLADALEDSVSSVLVATMKLSLFHGLFTWLTHNIFGAHVVYLPAILASILAAAPFLETYWCCLPAFLDLWLSQDRFYLGLLLVLIHFIVPSNFNPIIHSEIKGGGHPYLTALSIVGAMYLFGIEGAILGPLLLCLLVVLGTVTVNSLNSSPTTFTHQSSVEEPSSIASPATDWNFSRKSIQQHATDLDSTF